MHLSRDSKTTGYEPADPNRDSTTSEDFSDYDVLTADQLSAELDSEEQEARSQLNSVPKNPSLDPVSPPPSTVLPSNQLEENPHHSFSAPAVSAPRVNGCLPMSPCRGKILPPYNIEREKQDLTRSTTPPTSTSTFTQKRVIQGDRPVTNQTLDEVKVDVPLKTNEDHYFVVAVGNCPGVYRGKSTAFRSAGLDQQVELCECPQGIDEANERFVDLYMARNIKRLLPMGALSPIKANSIPPSLDAEETWWIVPGGLRPGVYKGRRTALRVADSCEQVLVECRNAKIAYMHFVNLYMAFKIPQFL